MAVSLKLGFWRFYVIAKLIGIEKVLAALVKCVRRLVHVCCEVSRGVGVGRNFVIGGLACGCCCVLELFASGGWGVLAYEMWLPYFIGYVSTIAVTPDYGGSND